MLRFIFYVLLFIAGMNIYYGYTDAKTEIKPKPSQEQLAQKIEETNNQKIEALLEKAKAIPGKDIYRNYYAYEELFSLDNLNQHFKNKKIEYENKIKALENKILNHFNSGKEPTVKDAMWEDLFFGSKQFTVGVIDNKTNRNGFAEYICLELLAQGVQAKDLRVKVIDIGKLVYQKEWVTLGLATCPN